ncbi:MAG: 1-acyl-sn-glycerol-3-phosphate acyltransferase [Deltaproteobacteria bacterium]|nr:1-acyl-sn-glycerol-3-phosphate acyltransferase [Deltaproteobacteria bacterium]
MEVPGSTRYRLLLQRCLGWVALLPLSIVIITLLKKRGRYLIADHGSVRRRFQRLVASSKAPIIVCANHLTLIDSVIMLWAFASPWSYFRNFRLFCWNLPAAENTRKRFSWTVITYLAKCLPVNRLGSASQTNLMLKRMVWLLKRGEIFMLFPEGTRSRAGSVNSDSVNYGVGKILKRLPGCRVLCLYLRGRQQSTYSDFPRKGEIFDIEMELITPHSEKDGLRGIKELSHQVISKLKQMEEDYFHRIHGRQQSAA